MFGKTYCVIAKKKKKGRNECVLKWKELNYGVAIQWETLQTNNMGDFVPLTWKDRHALILKMSLRLFTLPLFNINMNMIIYA